MLYAVSRCVSDRTPLDSLSFLTLQVRRLVFTSSTGSRQEVLLRSGAGTVTPVQPVTAHDQGSGPNASVQRWGAVRVNSH
jgi:hypothetical protein